MGAWIGIYRPSIAAPEPWWDGDAEGFTDLRHAVRVFAARNTGKRPTPPPQRIGWSEWGNPLLLPDTLPWLLPDVDKTAVLRLVALTSDTTLGGVLTMAARLETVVIRLNSHDHIIVTKPKGTP